MGGGGERERERERGGVVSLSSLSRLYTFAFSSFLLVIYLGQSGVCPQSPSLHTVHFSLLTEWVVGGHDGRSACLSPSQNSEAHPKHGLLAYPTPRGRGQAGRSCWACESEVGLTWSAPSSTQKKPCSSLPTTDDTGSRVECPRNLYRLEDIFFLFSFFFFWICVL